LQPPHTVPSTAALQYVAPLGGGPQVPSVLPAAIVQVDEQQSKSFEQTSFACTQNDEPSWQRPPVQRLEQHSESAAQVFPAVWQVVVSGAHVPAVQVPLQQLAPEVQAWLSEMHAVAPHLPATQLRLQHSVELPQLAPLGAHDAVLAAQVCVEASHRAEQQSAPV
jgi:hypothetical protein